MECNHADGYGHLCDLPPGHGGDHTGPHGSQRVWWDRDGKPLSDAVTKSAWWPNRLIWH